MIVVSAVIDSAKTKTVGYSHVLLTSRQLIISSMNISMLRSCHVSLTGGIYKDKVRTSVAYAFHNNGLK